MPGSLALRMPGHRRRVAVFFDGRNARGAAAKAFDSDELANFSPRQLARQVCEARGWRLASVSYYVGLPGEGRLVRGESREDWEKRLNHWRRQGVRVVTRPLSGRNKEKGIDVRLALDMTRQFRRGHYDVALIFSQDQDFQEVVEELRELGRLEGRHVITACAFPGREDPKFNRGIDNVDQTVVLPREVYQRSLETAPAGPQRRRILGVQIPNYRPIPFTFATYLGVALAVFLSSSIDDGLRAPSAQKGLLTAALNMGSNGAAAIVWPGFVVEWLVNPGGSPGEIKTPAPATGQELANRGGAGAPGVGADGRLPGAEGNGPAGVDPGAKAHENKAGAHDPPRQGMSHKDGA